MLALILRVNACSFSRVHQCYICGHNIGMALQTTSTFSRLRVHYLVNCSAPVLTLPARLNSIDRVFTAVASSRTHTCYSQRVHKVGNGVRLCRLLGVMWGDVVVSQIQAAVVFAYDGGVPRRGSRRTFDVSTWAETMHDPRPTDVASRARLCDDAWSSLNRDGAYLDRPRQLYTHSPGSPYWKCECLELLSLGLGKD